MTSPLEIDLHVIDGKEGDYYIEVEGMEVRIPYREDWPKDTPGLDGIAQATGRTWYELGRRGITEEMIVARYLQIVGGVPLPDPDRLD